MKKRILAIVLCLMMALTAGSFVFAADKAIGKTATIPSGTTVYSEADVNSESKQTWLNHTITIVDEKIGDDGTKWYKYSIDWDIGRLDEYPYVKASDVTLNDSDSDDIELPEDCVATLDEFVAITEDFPTLEEVTAFVEAESNYADAFRFTASDSNLPAGETEAYEEAYQEFAKAMGYTETVEATYPNPELEAELAELVLEAQFMFYDAEEQFLNENPDEDFEAVIEGTEYAEAKSLMEALIEANPDLSLGMAMFADSSSAVQKLEATGDNIEMHLFNYGCLINKEYYDGYKPNTLGGGYIPFTNSEYAYGWAQDNSGIDGVNATGGVPVLGKTVGADGYPYVKTPDANNYITAGSLKYLFDKNDGAGSPHIDEDTYWANIRNNNQNPYRYQSVHFPIGNNDGSGTGLFQKQGAYYVYDSLYNAAYYNKDTDKFDIYNYALRPACVVYSTSGVSSGNFLPFNLGHVEGREDYQTQKEDKYYDMNDDKKDGPNKDGKETKYSVCVKDDNPTKPSDAITTAYRLYGTSRASEVDLWFGISVEFDFFMPKSGEVIINESTGETEDMIFEFRGDDDVWVYIDDVLILDIGGTHGSCPGFIDFSTGDVTYRNGNNQAGSGKEETKTTLKEAYEAAYKEIEDKEGMEATAAKLKDIIDNGFVPVKDEDGTVIGYTFKDYTEHNFKMYYLERGGNISYCKLKFNMDPLPKGAMSVEKKEAELNSIYTGDEEYTFKLTDESGAALINKTYKVYKVGSSTVLREGATSAEGNFELKDGERAVFNSLDVTQKFKVEEITQTEAFETTCTVNDVAQTYGNKTAELEISDSVSQEIIFTNTWDSQNLSVSKSVEGENAPDNKYQIRLELKDVLYDGVAKIGGKEVTVSNGIIELKAGQTAVIEDIPENTEFDIYEEAATPATGYKYLNPEINGSEFVFGSEGVYNGQIENEDEVVNIVNTHVQMLGDLKITKDGIKPVDNDEGEEPEETQSTIFSIYDAENNFVMDVVINGNKSVTVKDLPVGDYKIVEKINWSWRYNPAVNDIVKTVVDMEVVEAEFDNSRPNNLWLNGGAYSRNLFGTLD